MRGRLAPTPSGMPHLGNARTALLAWLAVRKAGGALVMRIEDLDAARVMPGAEEAILDDLRWLGLDWDEGPHRQSERRHLYAQALDALLGAGHAYLCACSRAEVAHAASAPHAADDDGPRYPGTCRDLPPGAAQARAASLGRRVCVRFRGGAREPFDDLVRGPSDPMGTAGADDFVLRRNDGVHAYQLAVAVDDAAMGITDVVRGDDLLASAARQRALLRALGQTPPRYAHVPLVLAPTGERLAKRNRPLALAQLRRAGVPADAIVGALAASAGFGVRGQRLTPRMLVDEFDFARLTRAPAVIDDLEQRAAEQHGE